MGRDKAAIALPAEIDDACLAQITRAAEDLLTAIQTASTTAASRTPSFVAYTAQLAVLGAAELTEIDALVAVSHARVSVAFRLSPCAGQFIQSCNNMAAAEVQLIHSYVGLFAARQADSGGLH